MEKKRNLKMIVFILSLTIALILLAAGCSMAGIGSEKESSSSNGSDTGTNEITMNGSFKISVDPKTNTGLYSILKSIVVETYTVTALDITVTSVSSGSTIGTYQWTPANGAATYDVPIAGTGEYNLTVVQTASNNGNIVSSTDSVVVNVQPLIVTVVTIVPGATLTVGVNTGSSSSSSANSSSSSSSSSVSYLYHMTDYFPTTPGYGILYEITDTQNSTAIQAWKVFQDSQKNLPDAEIEAFYTLNDNANNNFKNSIAIKYSTNYINYFRAAYGHSLSKFMHRHIYMPKNFNSGETWQSTWTNGDGTSFVRNFSLTKLTDPVTVNQVTFNDCISIAVDNTNDTDNYTKGSGYLIYAKNVGIIKIEFTRSADNTVVTYNYFGSNTFAKYSISGIVNVSGVPYANNYVQLGCRNWGNRAQTGADGSFSINAYGPAIYLYFGEDADNDNILDETSPAVVRTYHLNNIYSDTSGLAINF